MEQIVFLTFTLLLLVAISTSVVQVQSKYYDESVPHKPVQEYKTNLRFYIHDILSGTKPTALHIAGPTDVHNPTPFGSTFAIDDPLTEGPDGKSKVIGNARGMYVSAERDGHLTLVLYVDLGFTTGKFENSSLSVFSRNPVNENPREMAIVGGRGRFRMAKGSVWVRTIFLNLTTGDAVLEYAVEVVHP